MKTGVTNGPEALGPPKALGRSKAQIIDDSIMGTNNSSIVSKRSVERLYFPNEEHFFRYFVKKPKRRSPLVNRGYWLRMKAVDQVVLKFLEENSTKRKVVINLGCGYDPLPWQCLSRYHSLCKGVKFVDIDYKDLMIKKRDVVQSTSQLSSVLTNVEVSDSDVSLRSDQYLQIGCDLRNLEHLHRLLRETVDIDNCFVLFTAEVSITYMDVKSADSLIRWTATLPEARFCLLEQILPEGLDHPFAKTMMAHFNKLQTPLGAVQKYPTTCAQKKRFQDLGWEASKVCNLWQLWVDSVGSDERKSIDLIEPFDEWEEFALFGSHYFLLVADTSSDRVLEDNGSISHDRHSDISQLAKSMATRYSEYPKGQGFRRFAALLPIRGSDPAQDKVGVFAGMGLNTRVDTTDVYNTDPSDSLIPTPKSLSPSSRMCHSTTDLDDAGVLLIGGRTSPDNALRDCWIYHKWLQVWERVDDIPQARYRHQSVSLGLGYVLMSPGRSDSKTISRGFFIWNRRTGWTGCVCDDSSVPSPTYGATLLLSHTNNLNNISASRCGLIAGGIDEYGVLRQEIWKWEIRNLSSSPTLTFERCGKIDGENLITRFGASVVNQNGQAYIVGGIIKHQILSHAEEVCLVKISGTDITVIPVFLDNAETIPRPLLIGTTIGLVEEALVITGGSAVCFSFGTFWNKGCYTLHEPHKLSDVESAPILATWHYMSTIGTTSQKKMEDPAVSPPPADLVTVPRLQIKSAAEFNQILQAAKPAILEGLDIGNCTMKWTSSYLKEQVGIDREIIVHEATTEHMKFKSKNFSYVTKKFGEFVDDIDSGRRLYLRSLSSEKPSELPANISKDFPSISADFQIPPELSVTKDNAHSAPLRMSGSVTMWLHYDVMANILCQIKGSKRLLLFPPTDAGASSSDVNAFEMLKDSSLAHSHPHEAVLKPGDILFLPSLWLHTASPTSGMSIAVNVFFRSLTSGYAAGKDVYGNRDLQAYEKGRQDITRIAKLFEGLSPDIREFYVQRLVDELKQKTH